MFAPLENNFTVCQLISDHCTHYDFAAIIIVLYIFMATFFYTCYKKDKEEVTKTKWQCKISTPIVKVVFEVTDVRGQKG